MAEATTSSELYVVQHEEDRPAGGGLRGEEAWFTGWRPTVYAPPLFSVSSRTTHMDIMVTTNTARRYVEPGERRASGVPRRAGRSSGKLRPRCRLPYELTLGSPKVDTSATTTLAQVLVDGISRRRTNDTMHEERRLFMMRLARERDDRTEEEHKSAILCQAMFRGRLERRRSREGSETLAPLPVPPRRFGYEIRGGGGFGGSEDGRGGDDASWRSNPSAGSADGDRSEPFDKHRHRQEVAAYNADLSRELLALAKAAGLAPMRGVTLAPKPRRTKKHALEEKKRAARVDAAARVLQDLARRKCAKKRAHELLKTMLFSAQQKAVSAIQRTYRGHLARDEMLLKKSNFAAQLLQTRYRKIMAISKMINAKRALLQRKREVDAVLRIQNAIRRKAAKLRVSGLWQIMIANRPKPVEEPRSGGHHKKQAPPKKSSSPKRNAHLQWRPDYR